MKEICQWIESNESLSRKGNNIFEIKFSRGRITRKDTPPQLSYQIFLDSSDDYESIRNHFGGTFSWTWYRSDTIYYYGGNYILVEGNGPMKEIYRILNIETKW